MAAKTRAPRQETGDKGKRRRPGAAEAEAATARIPKMLFPGVSPSNLPDSLKMRFAEVLDALRPIVEAVQAAEPLIASS